MFSVGSSFTVGIFSIGFVSIGFVSVLPLTILYRNVQRFRGGLVFKAHRLCVSLNSRRESNKEEEKGVFSVGSSFTVGIFSIGFVSIGFVSVPPPKLTDLYRKPGMLTFENRVRKS